MPRRPVPHCDSCPYAETMSAGGRGVYQFWYCTYPVHSTGTEAVPMSGREIAHTSPKWCPKRLKPGTVMSFKTVRQQWTPPSKPAGGPLRGRRPASPPPAGEQCSLFERERKEA